MSYRGKGNHDKETSKHRGKIARSKPHKSPYVQYGDRPILADFSWGREERCPTYLIHKHPIPGKWIYPKKGYIKWSKKA